ncbi:MAG: hypothetical protein AB7H77_05825 [Bdellovibrionales bacterium]
MSGNWNGLRASFLAAGVSLVSAYGTLTLGANYVNDLLAQQRQLSSQTWDAAAKISSPDQAVAVTKALRNETAPLNKLARVSNAAEDVGLVVMALGVSMIAGALPKRSRRAVANPNQPASPGV